MIAITKVPVMYRLLEYSGEPAKTADTRQEQPPKKRQTGRESLQKGAVETTTAHNCWEASDQRRNETLLISSGVSCV